MLKKINYGNRKIFIILLELVEVVAVGSVFVREVVKGAVGTEMEVVVGVAVVVGPRGGRGGILPMDVMGPTMGEGRGGGESVMTGVAGATQDCELLAVKREALARVCA